MEKSIVNHSGQRWLHYGKVDAYKAAELGQIGRDPLTMQYKGTTKENTISILVWKLSSSFHFRVKIKVYSESFGFSNRNIFLEEKLLGLNSMVKLEKESIFILYNQHILLVNRVQFFIMHYSMYYKCTSTHFWKDLTYKHTQAVYPWIQRSLYFTLSFYHLNSQY